jgi:hypothetical protein
MSYGGGGGNKALDERKLEWIFKIINSNERNLKFYNKNEEKWLISKEDILKEFDKTLVETPDLDKRVDLALSVMLKALEATRRTKHSYIRKRLLYMIKLFLRHKQIPPVNRDLYATRNFLFEFGCLFIELYDEHLLNTTDIEDKLIADVRRGVFETTEMVSDLRQYVDDGDEVDQMEEFEEYKKSKKKGRGSKAGV